MMVQHSHITYMKRPVIMAAIALISCLFVICCLYLPYYMDANSINNLREGSYANCVFNMLDSEQVSCAIDMGIRESHLSREQACTIRTIIENVIGANTTKECKSISLYVSASPECKIYYTVVHDNGIKSDIYFFIYVFANVIEIKYNDVTVAYVTDNKTFLPLISYLKQYPNRLWKKNG
jgi:hypothetical protein